MPLHHGLMVLPDTGSSEACGGAAGTGYAALPFWIM
jgi:hypothetical protein